MGEYRTKYYSSYKNLFDRITTVLIKEYSDDNIYAIKQEITLGQDPFLLRLIDDENFFEQVKGSEATLSIYSPSSLEYSELYLSKPKTYQMYVYHGDPDSEIIKNRSFHGGFEDWDKTTGFQFYNNSAKLIGSLSEGLLEQNASFKESSSFNFRIQYSDANLVYNPDSLEKLEIYLDGVFKGQVTLTTASGEALMSIIVNLSEINSVLTIKKTWTGTLHTSSIIISNVSILKSPATTHEYNIFFAGYIDNSTITEPYVLDKYILQVRAYCGLGELDQLDYKNVVELYPGKFTDDYYYGTNSLIKILAEVLNKTGIYLPIKSRIALYDTQTMSTGDDPLELRINKERFRSKDQSSDKEVLTCQKVIQEILKIFGARILQCNGFWKIERIIDKIEKENEYRYNQFGDYIKIVSNIDEVVPMTLSNPLLNDKSFFVNGSQYIKVDQPINKLIINQNFGYRNSFIMGDFDNAFWNYSGNPRYWQVNGDASGNIERNGERLRFKDLLNYTINFNDIINANLSHVIGLPYTEYIFYSQSSDQWSIKRSKLKITFNCTFKPATGTAYYDINVPFMIYIVGNSGTYWMGHNGEWLTDIQYIWGSTANGSYDMTTDELPGAEFKLFTRIINPRRSTAGSSIHGSVEIWNFRITKTLFDEPDNFEKEVEKEYIIEASGNKKEEVNVLLGDVGTRNSPAYREIYQKTGLLFGVNLYGKLTNITNAWGKWGTSGRENLIFDILKQSYLDQFSVPRFIISGDIIGIADFSSIIYDSVKNENRYFLFLGGDYNDYYQQLSGEWIEIGQPATKDAYSGVGEFDSSDFGYTEFKTELED